MKAMILAAGRGERMRPLSDRMPKPLLEAGGYRLIEYHLAALRNAGIRDVVVNLSWLGDQIREALGDGSRYGLSISYSPEGPTPLGTGGGIHRALPLLGADPFLLVNGDVWIDLPFTELRRPAGSLAPPRAGREPAASPWRRLRARSRRAGQVGADAADLYGSRSPRSAPVRRMRGRRFPLKPLLDRALAAGRLSGQQHDGTWSDVGTPERLASLDAALRLGQVRHPVLESPVG